MTAKGVAKDFGRYLQSCRRDCGVSLEIISHQTKITVENLRRIENEYLDQLPSPVFVKGFIKSFAHAVGAEPEAAVLRLENYLADKDQTPAVSVTKPTTSFNWYHLAIAVVLFASLIGATLYLAGQMHQALPVAPHAVAATSETPDPSDGFEKKPFDPANVQSTPTEKEPLPAHNALEVEETTPANRAPVIEKPPTQPVIVPAQVLPPPDSFELRISAVEATWFKVASDDNLPREYLLQADQDITLKAERQFNLTIGNAGGIRLVLNDKPVQVGGTSGQVVRLRLP